MTLVHLQRLPKHIAIIMDGNGRWAQHQGFLRTLGHREGSESVRRVVRACRRLGVKALTLYAFSEQNWQRPNAEVTALMSLLREFLISERDEILDNEIRLRAVGRSQRLPQHVREVLDPLAAQTANFQRMTLTLALSYGGREEIADAAQALATRVANGTLDPNEVNEQMLTAAIPSMDVGPVDLLIRTGGEVRISNFLIWGAAYAELYFSPTLWPEYSEHDLYQAIAAYQSRERRFGTVLNNVETSAEPNDPIATTAHA